MRGRAIADNAGTRDRSAPARTSRMCSGSPELFLNACMTRTARLPRLPIKYPRTRRRIQSRVITSDTLAGDCQIKLCTRSALCKQVSLSREAGEGRGEGGSKAHAGIEDRALMRRSIE